jgi:long-chain acyl-CoA synthetase
VRRFERRALMPEPHLTDALQHAAREHAARIALSGEGVQLSYAQLLAHARDVSQALTSRGARADEPVLVMCSNHPLDVVAFFAVWLAGAVVVPVHRTSPPAVLAAIQHKARCRLRLDRVGASDAAGAITALDGDAAPASGAAMSDAARSDAATDDADSAARRALLRGAAWVIFTSGSTGAPKGVVLSHAAFARKLQHNQRVFALGPDTVTLLVLNDTFSFGLWVALLTLSHGGRVALQSRFTPPAFLDALADEGVSFVGVVPTMMRATFGTLGDDALERARARLRAAARLRTVVIGGEPLGATLSARLREFIAPAQLFDVYGLTETSTSDFILHPADAAAHAGSIGIEAAGVRSRIVGDDGALCAIGQAGELQLQTSTLMAGYLGDAVLTEAAFVDGWFRTGDLAVREADGFVSIVGRRKELINRGGNKITPLEVERALAGCSGVAAALVAGVDDPLLGQRIHALLIPRAGSVLDAAQIRHELAPRLEKYKHPDVCYVGTELPTGRTGKIDRTQLPALLAAGRITPMAAWNAERAPKETAR